MRRFEVGIHTYVEIELDDAVINVVDDEWRSQLYNLKTPEEIAEHVAYNLVINKAHLSQLDGWVDQPDENAKLISKEPDWNMLARELPVVKG